MGEVWVGWKSDDMEANIRTFPPIPPTHDIAVRFALLLCPDWVGEGGTASLPPPPPLSVSSHPLPHPLPSLPPATHSSDYQNPVFPRRIPVPWVSGGRGWELKFDLSRFYWMTAAKDNHSEPCCQVSV